MKIRPNFKRTHTERGTRQNKDKSTCRSSAHSANRSILSDTLELALLIVGGLHRVAELILATRTRCAATAGASWLVFSLLLVVFNFYLFLGKISAGWFIISTTQAS